MALLMNDYKLSSGLMSKEAYLKVGFISGSKENMSFDIKVYISKEASDEGLSTIEEFSVAFMPDTANESLNYHTQAYVWLKTLPEYNNATDVLED